LLEGTFRYDRKGGVHEALANLDIPTGANGGDSGMVLEYLTAAFAAPNFRPDLLLLNCGLHDIKRPVGSGEIQVPLERYRENLEAITGLVQSHHVKLAWIRTTHCVTEIHNHREGMAFHRFTEDNDAYNAVADEVMTGRSVPMIDLHRFTRQIGPDRELFIDHVHFAESVRHLQAAYLAGWLDRHFLNPS